MATLNSMSIWKAHENTFNWSDPQPNWMFEVSFLSNDGTDLQLNDLLPITADLPKYETQIIQRNFLGTEKSFAINRKFSGDMSMEFYMRVEHDREELLNTVSGLLDRPKQPMDPWYHNELDRTIDKIKVELKDRKGNTRQIYTFMNCIISNFSMTELSYEGEEQVKCTLEWHYDYWSKEG